MNNEISIHAEDEYKYAQGGICNVQIKDIQTEYEYLKWKCIENKFDLGIEENKERVLMMAKLMENETNKKYKKILVMDFDNVLCNSMIGCSTYIAEKYGKFFETIGSYYVRSSNGLCHVNDIEWGFKNIFVDLSDEQINSIFLDEQLYSKLYDHIFPGADKVLKQLQNQGYEVKICSINRKKTSEAKRKLIKRAFPFVSNENIIVIENDDTGSIVMSKSQVEGWLIIDDHISILESSPCTFKACFGRYQWNESYKGLRIDNLNQIFKVIKNIEHCEMMEDVINEIHNK